MLPIVFWNTIVSVVIVSWCRQGFTMMVVLPWWELMERSMPWSTGMRYCSIKLFHYYDAWVCWKFQQQNNVHVLPWPGRSADLSRIEHLWDILDIGVRQRNPLPETVHELFVALHNEWQNPNAPFKIVLPPCVVVVQLLLQHEEDTTDTEHCDTLWLIHITWHTSALTHQVQNGVV